MNTRATPPERPDLVFRGMSLCDGCGVPLAPDEQLWGLCPRCLSGDSKEPSRDGGSP